MKRLNFIVVLTIAVAVTVSFGLSNISHASNTPPTVDATGKLLPVLAPDGVTLLPANPAVQSDGVLIPDVFGSTPNWNLTPPIRKFVDSLAPLGCNAPNNLGQCIPVAVPDKQTFPGSDYYEIELRRYTEQVHSDLPATTFQGYVQVNSGKDANGANVVAPAPIHYLGPLIITQKGTPVRIKFINKLPHENAEPFFLPVDRTVMGAGMGSKNADGSACDPVWDPRGRGLPTTEPTCASYTTNRAELHLHGGLSPWISDGTPHQWITPAGEATPYKKADNVQYVPDMWFNGSGNVIASCAGNLTCGVSGASTNPGDGAQTFYYTNDQSARLMFYHDHSFGITRLNVYAGEAAGYMIQDPTELDLISRGVIPSDQIPLVIQDKAFIDPATIGTLDPTWAWGTGPTLPPVWIDATGVEIASCAGNSTCGVNGARKVVGRTPKAGDLWWPHVYLPAENPSALGGVNPMGRWVYGLYFWPPTTGIKFLPVNNPYYDCDPLGVCNAPWEPPTMPATPNPSWVAEAFVDTPMVNGTVYPKLDVQPKAYRLRILNAAHDRFFNLQLYVADTTVNANVTNAAACTALGGCATNTEVKMVPAIKYPAFPLWDAPADQRAGGVPDPATSGPAWIQIGNEGGFLPAPTVIPSQPISFVMDPTLFNVGNVNDGSLIMGPAERADVIVDFSKYAGKTLILYNDAPAAFPAFVPNNDYYTDGPDNTGTGGHPGPKAGIGPNTRTIMQINVAAAAPAAEFDLNKLNSEFTTTPTQDSVFKKSQHPTIVGQTAYDTAYNLLFPAVAPFWGIANIGDQNISFASLNATTLAPEIVNSYPMQPKALHDEMGAVWDEYGRMSAKLGVELPNTNNINQIFVMQNYVDPPTENVQDGKVQIWKLTHNGVDTHPLHFHLFDVQVINRVGWDGFVRLPWPNELGWKETVRISPLEDTIVAMRPKAPPVPFPLQDSMRLKNPVYPDNANVTDGFMNLNPLTGQAKIPADNNAGLFNYGAEYVWHCHILSHEEQDMMRPLVLRVATGVPADPTGLTATAGFQKNSLAWTDNSYNGTIANPYNLTLGFYIERCDGICDANTGVFSRIGDMTMISSTNPTYIDDKVTSNATYTYRVIGYNRYTTNGAANGSWIDGLTAPAYSAAVVSSFWSPASAITLVPDFASPHVVPVKFVSLASGTNVQPQYRFSVNNSVVQDYSVTRYWVMPVGTTPGNYTVTVDARTNYASTTPDISQSIVYNVLPTIDIVPPVTTAIPAAGAFLNPVQVYLQVNEPGSVIRYTIDGTTPSPTNAIIYSGPISISATTTLQYYSTDPAGNPEVVQSGLYELRPIDLQASVKINGGATFTNNTTVAISVTAVGAAEMQFSNTGITVPDSYSAAVAFSPLGQTWTLDPGPDGLRSVYVRLKGVDTILRAPIVAQITLDTIAPVTTPMPTPGTYLTPVLVALTTDHPTAVIKYSTNGSDPSITGNGTLYTGPFTVSATTAVKYFATDEAGNAEAVKTSIYTIHTGSLTVNTFNINGGAAVTNSTAVTLNVSATEPTGVTKMRFSNDGINYPFGDINYATTAPWTLTSGDGVKNVYVRFTDGAGKLYDAVTAQIVFDTTPPISSVFPPPAGTYVNPVSVAITSNEAVKYIKFTLDGSDPLLNPAAVIYSSPILISTSKTLKYAATDIAGNDEAVKSASYTIDSSITATIAINSNAAITNNPSVTLAVSAPGSTSMQFSNNGVNYSNAIGYSTVDQVWMLDPVDGNKAVFVKFLDAVGNPLNVISSQIILDTTAPVTTPAPAAGTYLDGVNVTLTANEVGSSILYSLDGSAPSVPYSGAAIPINSTKTLLYSATDIAINKEAVKSATYTIVPSVIAGASITVNGGAAKTNNGTVSLALTATAGVDKMSFSINGGAYSAKVAFASSTTLDLTPGDGDKYISVKFFDTAKNLSYAAVNALPITLDTVAPSTSITPPAGIYIAKVDMTMTANEPGSTITYTLNGEDPTTSASAVTAASPVTLTNVITSTTTVRYFATDTANNTETPKSVIYTIDNSDLTVTTFNINSAAATTKSRNVTLTIDAADAITNGTYPNGLTSMRFSNDGVNYPEGDVPYATSKSWLLSDGDGLKTVFVRFTDIAGQLYDPVTATIILDTVKPTTFVNPAPGIYLTPFTVTLSANEAVSYIKYTTDGSEPTAASATYDPSTPININGNTILKYYAQDVAGNNEAVKTADFIIHTGDLAVQTFNVNSGAAATNNTSVVLSISATDEYGVTKMRFSNTNNGTDYTQDEAYSTSKNWTLSGGDGVKTIYAKFTDGSGRLYDPVSTQIKLDTLAAVTTATPVSGTISATPISVTLSAEDGTGSGIDYIRYTTDNSDPTTSSSAVTYTTPITVQENTEMTIRFYSKDIAGNSEVAKSAIYKVTHIDDMVASVAINSGETVTVNPTVMLHLSATDSTGVASMQFSNDGSLYSSFEGYAATKSWPLSSGEGLKTVYVKFKDSVGNVYGPYTAQITLAFKNGLLPGTTGQMASALRALQIAKGNIVATPADLAHADVAPFVNGAPKPDGKIDLGDVYVLLLNLVGVLGLQ